MRVLAVTEKTAPYFAHLADKETYRQVNEGEYLALGALDGDGDEARPAGLLCCRIDPMSVEITWLYVDEEFRGNGAGTALLFRLLDIVAEEISILEVTMTFCTDDGLDDLANLLDSVGFELQEKRTFCYEAKMKDLSKIEPFKLKHKAKVFSINDLSNNSLKKFSFELKDMKNLLPLPLEKGNYHESSCVCMENESVIGAIFIREISDEHVSIDWIYSKQGHSLALPLLLNETISKLTKAYSASTKVTFATVNENSASLAKKLLPNATSHEVTVWAMDMTDGLVK